MALQCEHGIKKSKILLAFCSLIRTFAVGFEKSMVCRDGGMVDTRDLKSLGYCSCAGSSPARGTHLRKGFAFVAGPFLFLKFFYSLKNSFLWVEIYVSGREMYIAGRKMCISGRAMYVSGRAIENTSIIVLIFLVYL